MGQTQLRVQHYRETPALLLLLWVAVCNLSFWSLKLNTQLLFNIWF